MVGVEQRMPDAVDRLVADYAANHPELVEWMRMTREAAAVRDRVVVVAITEPIARYSRA